MLIEPAMTMIPPINEAKVQRVHSILVSNLSDLAILANPCIDVVDAYLNPIDFSNLAGVSFDPFASFGLLITKT